MQVDICYLAPGIQDCRSLQVPPGSTVADALRLSGLLTQYPEIDLSRQKIGVWNKAVSPETPLREHDRVEIYRPLTADPKTARRQRVAAGKTMGATKG